VRGVIVRGVRNLFVYDNAVLWCGYRCHADRGLYGVRRRTFRARPGAPLPGGRGALPAGHRRGIPDAHDGDGVIRQHIDDGNGACPYFPSTFLLSTSGVYPS
jgi:hypothetical protein